MNASTENSTEKTLEKVSDEKPVSVYSVNFNRVINNFTEKKSGFIVKRKGKTGEIAVQKSFSGRVFNWRNASAVAAILAIGVLHFAFQISFIRSEVSENRPAAEAPPIEVLPVKTEPAQVAAPPVMAKPAAFEMKKIDSRPLPAPKTVPSVRQRQSEIAPSKPQSKKKEAGETRAERLRRAERLLTGI